MGILACNEIGEGRLGVMTENLERRYTRVWQVITDDPFTDAAEVKAAAGIPSLGDVFETANTTDSGALVVSIQPEQQTDLYFWKVKVEYSSFADPDAADPLARRPKKRWSTQTFSVPANEDITGDALKDDTIVKKAITNSAYDPFDPPQEKDDATFTLTYTRNEADFDPVGTLQWINAVNDDDFLGFGPGTCKIKSIDATEMEENGVRFWEVTYVFEFRDTWHLKPLDQGYREYDRTTATWAPAKDRNGRPVTQPALLDGFGRVLDIENHDPVFLDFQVYQEVSFAPLEIEE